MASTRRFMLPALLLMLALPLAGEAHSLDAPKAPPTDPVFEVDPGDRTGYTRATGHWEWTGDKFMWSPGSWVEDKEGSVWVADSWTQRGKKWHLTPGHYEPDGSTPVTIPTEASDEIRAVKSGPKHELQSENGEAPAVRENEMDDVEGKVLAPSKKTVTTTKTAAHKGKHVATRKKLDYNDPKQFPFYHRH